MTRIVSTTGVLQYEPFGFTNCVRYRNVLYLSGISALDPQGRVVGSSVERKPPKHIKISSRCCGQPDRPQTGFSR